MECFKCEAPLTEENQCCDGGKSCKDCCRCADGAADKDCGCA